MLYRALIQREATLKMIKILLIRKRVKGKTKTRTKRNNVQNLNKKIKKSLKLNNLVFLSPSNNKFNCQYKSSNPKSKKIQITKKKWIRRLNYRMAKQWMQTKAKYKHRQIGKARRLIRNKHKNRNRITQSRMNKMINKKC